MRCSADTVPRSLFWETPTDATGTRHGSQYPIDDVSGVLGRQLNRFEGTIESKRDARAHGIRRDGNERTHLLAIGNTPLVTAGVWGRQVVGTRGFLAGEEFLGGSPRPIDALAARITELWGCPRRLRAGEHERRGESG